MPLTQESPRHNLKLLWWLRNIAIAGQTVTVAFVSRVLGLSLPLTPLFAIIALLAAVNLLTWLRLKRATPVTQAEFFIQLLIDMLGLAGLLYFTGGAGNPFTSLFILQVVIAAIALPPLYSWLAAAVAIALYTLLMIRKMDLPMPHMHGGDFFSLHVQGMWINFLLLAVLVAWFVARMSATLRRQDMLLADAEQMAVLGTFATQAAHDLGTPLATMAILAEACREEAETDTQRKRAATLTRQIERCKESISHIAASAGVMRAASGRPVPLGDYLHGIAHHFHRMCPEVHFIAEIGGTEPVPVITAGIGLEQAIANVLANAAAASGHYVRFEARWTPQALMLAVADKGRGIPEAIQSRLGTPGLTTKQDGLGMGLYLTQAVIMRLSGTLKAELPPGGGTCMRIELPLSRLLA